MWCGTIRSGSTRRELANKTNYTRRSLKQGSAAAYRGNLMPRSGLVLRAAEIALANRELNFDRSGACIDGGIARCRTDSPRHDQPRGEGLNDLAMPIARFTADTNAAPIWLRARRCDFDDLADHAESIARLRGLQPTQLTAIADNAASDRQPALHQQPH